MIRRDIIDNAGARKTDILLLAKARKVFFVSSWTYRSLLIVEADGDYPYAKRVRNFEPIFSVE